MAKSKLTSIAAVVGLLAVSGAGYWYMNKAEAPKVLAAAPAGSSATGAPSAPSAGGAPAPSGTAASAASGGSGAAGAPAAPPPVPAVEIAKPEVQKLQDDAQAVGTLRSRQNVMLRPEVPGRIAQLNFADGARVRKGQTLVQLDDTLQRAEVRQANAQVSIARANYKRNQELVAQNFVAQRVLDESDANLQVAEAQMALACARFERMKIVAPFDATVGIRNVNIGDYVKDGADLVNLEDLGTMFVDFKIPERFASKLRVGQTVEISLEAFPTRLFKATVNALDPLIDANGRAISVRASLPNNMGEPAPRPSGPGGSGGPGGGGGATAAGAASGTVGGKPPTAGSGGGKPAAQSSILGSAQGGAQAAGRPGAGGPGAAAGGRGGPNHGGGRPGGAGPQAGQPEVTETAPNPCAGLNAQGRMGSPTTGLGGRPAGNEGAAAARGGGRPQGSTGSATAGASASGQSGGAPRTGVSTTGGGGRPGGVPGGAGGPQPLRPGMFAKVVAVFNVKDQAITVPEEAIVPQAGRQFVIKLFEDGKNDKGEPKWVTQRTEVKLGIRRGGKVEITEGVAVEDTLVVAGQQRLQRDGTAVRIIDVPRGPSGPSGSGAPGGAPGGGAGGGAGGPPASGASPSGSAPASGSPGGANSPASPSGNPSGTTAPVPPVAPNPPAAPASPAAPAGPRS